MSLEGDLSWASWSCTLRVFGSWVKVVRRRVGCGLIMANFLLVGDPGTGVSVRQRDVGRGVLISIRGFGG